MAIHYTKKIKGLVHAYKAKASNRYPDFDSLALT